MIPSSRSSNLFTVSTIVLWHTARIFRDAFLHNKIWSGEAPYKLWLGTWFPELIYRSSSFGFYCTKFSELKDPKDSNKNLRIPWDILTDFEFYLICYGSKISLKSTSFIFFPASI
jgi:hypothetical protein